MVYTFLIVGSFQMAVFRAIRDHEAFLTHTTGKLNRRGHYTRRPLKHIKAREKLVRAYLDHTKAFKYYKVEVYVQMGSRRV